jgi:hypothetical protein
MLATKRLDGVVAGIAEEIQRIGLERCRTRRHACGDLDCEHRRIDGEHGKEHTPVASIPAMGIDRLVAALSAHVSDLHARMPQFKENRSDQSLSCDPG